MKSVKRKTPKVIQGAISIPPEKLVITSDFIFGHSQDVSGLGLTPFPKLNNVDAIGIDASYKSTGLAIRKGDDVFTGIMTPFPIVPVKRRVSGRIEPKIVSGESYLAKIIKDYYEMYLLLLETYNPKIVCVEDVTKQLGNPEKMVSARAGLRLALINFNHRKVAFVEPTKLKKISTGSGKATKDDMVASCEMLYNYSMWEKYFYDDQCDALFLANLAYNHSMFTQVRLTPYF